MITNNLAKIKLTIGKKISGGFIIVILVVLLSGVYNFLALSEQISSIQNGTDSIETTLEAPNDSNLQIVNSLESLRNNLLILGGLTILIAIVISFLLVQNLIPPLLKLKTKIAQFKEKGVIPEVLDIKSNDEIGEMGEGMNSLLGGLKAISEFAMNIGNGKLDMGFEARSREDVFGQALIAMRDNFEYGH